jgi:prevent-host-death family protein
MTRTLTLRDANRTFARRIRDVEAGEDFIITRNGRPVARLTPVTEHDVLTRRRLAALDGLKAMMDHGWRLGAEPFDRDVLHER